jgi:lipid A 3-O-deacylase
MAGLLLVLLVLLVLQAPVAAAQQQGTLRLQLDNDAYNFWLHPAERTDEEYTNGVRVTYEGGWRPVWASLVWRGAEECGARRTPPGSAGALAPCLNRRTWLGQDIYNPRRDAGERPLSETRPNAGWLYLGQALDRASFRRLDRAEVTVGVTGRPSMAATVQQIAHGMAPSFNRPIDWSTQLAFEPGLIVRLSTSRLARASSGAIEAELVPSASVAAGNVLTEATAGLRIRAGAGLPHPWRPEGPARSFIAVHAAVNARGVVRDLFLDGNSFRRGPRVGHEPLVVEREAGITMHWRGVSAGFSTLRRDRTYAAGAAHSWSSMHASVPLRR